MKTPRPHQTEAIKAVVKGFKSHKRGKLIMACGTGKTLIAGWVREKLKARCTLFMAPSNALLAQTLQAWREIAETPFEALAVCCDASVAQGQDDDDMPAANVGAAVTTDYQRIANFISSAGERAVFCTYQSGEALVSAMSLVSVPPFDLAIADEAHRTTGGADHLFPAIVHKDKIRATNRLFMTATPRFYFDNGLDKIVSMDDEELYGPVFHELDFAEAIKVGLLTDYEILVVGVSPEHEKEAVALITKNPHLKVADRKLAARDIAVNIAVLRAIKERKLERVITFHGSCPKAQAAADFLPKLQDWMLEEYRTDTKLWARTVNHKLSIGDRHALMHQFVALDGPGVLTNCRCLGEGVDVPTVDAIAFMDSKKSKIEIAQAVGRAIRLSPGKKKSYIIVPVIVLPGDGQKQVNGKKFKSAVDVINALRSHDSTLMDQVKHWVDSDRSGTKSGGGTVDTDGGRKITFNIPKDCDPRIAEWFVCRVSKCKKTRAERKAEVDAFFAAHGRVPRAKDGECGVWFESIRAQRSAGELSGKMLAWYDGLNSAPVYSAEVRWMETFNSLKESISKYGKPEVKLRAWWYVQRRLLRNGKLDIKKASLLKLLGHMSKEAEVVKKAKLVEDYIKTNGCLPSTNDPKVATLGVWCLRMIKNPTRFVSEHLGDWLDAVSKAPTARDLRFKKKRASFLNTFIEEYSDYVAKTGHRPPRGHRLSKIFAMRSCTTGLPSEWKSEMLAVPTFRSYTASRNATTRGIAKRI